MSPDALDQAIQNAFQHHRSGRLADAEAIYRRILQEHPEHPQATHLLGLVAHQRGAHDTAEELMRRSIALQPTTGYFHKNLAEVLRAKGQFDQAIAAYEKALELDPKDGLAHHCIGVIHEKAERNEQAIAAYRRAIELAPSHAPAYLNLGVLLERLGQYEEALRLFEQALSLRPDYPMARMARATALLRLGRYEEGWRDYEWRWRIQPFSRLAPDPRWPVWDGSNLAGRTILLRFEQGLGDTLLFARFAPLVAQRGGKVILQVQPPLVRLMQRVPGVTAIVPEGQLPPPFHVQAPLMSLPRILGTRPDTIPSDPYLSPDPSQAESWRTRLAGDRGVKVGLVWAGGPQYPNDRLRSIRLEMLAPLAAIQGVTFYSLQKGAPAAQAANPPPGMRLVDYTAELNDFADTAALAANLDLVITVDTSVCHLAGGLGRPVWTLVTFIPDFRWFLNREDTPWYPSMRLFRQPAIEDWKTPIQRVTDDLARLAAQHHP